MENIQIKELKVKKFNVVKNTLLQNYVSKRPNNIICIDTLFLTKKSIFLLVIDVATRVVYGQLFKNSCIETSDVHEYLPSMLYNRSFISEILIMNSYTGILFTNGRNYAFLKSRNITVSHSYLEAPIKL